MKKSLTIILLFLTSIASAVGNPELRISTLKYEPYPAEPGRYVKIWLNIENRGLESAKAISFVLEPEYPFSIEENATRYFGEIRSSENVVIDYKLRVASDAVEGENELNLRYNIGSVWFKVPIRIYIQTRDAIISVEDVESIPKQIVPGSNAVVNIKLRNPTNSEVKDIAVKLNLTGTVFAPIGSIAEKRVNLLLAGEDRGVTFNLVAEPSAEAKLYKVPITISYNDAIGNRYTKSDFITLIVGDKPNIIATIGGSTILKAGETGKIVINIINSGLTGVKLLTAKIEKTDKFEILSPSNEIYIGNLDVDDYETIEFSIYVGKDAGENLPLPIRLEYRDNNNNLFTEQKIVNLRLYSEEEIRRLGLRKTSSSLEIILVFVIILLGYFGYRRIRKKR